MQNPVARVYAQALFELALEKKELEAVAADFDSFMKSYEAIEELRLLLQSPRVKLHEDPSVIEQMVGPKATRAFRNFLGVLSERRRFWELPNIHEAFVDLRDLNAGRVRCRVVVPSDSDQELLREIREFVKKQVQTDVELEVRPDPEILGGAVIRLEDTVLDASLRSQLRRLASELRAPADSVPLAPEAK